MFLLFLLMFGGMYLYKNMYMPASSLLLIGVQTQLIVANVQNAHLVSLRCHWRHEGQKIKHSATPFT